MDRKYLIYYLISRNPKKPIWKIIEKEMKEDTPVNRMAAINPCVLEL